MTDNATATTAIQDFIQRWENSGAAERANYQLFLGEGRGGAHFDDGRHRWRTQRLDTKSRGGTLPGYADAPRLRDVAKCALRIVMLLLRTTQAGGACVPRKLRDDFVDVELLQQRGKIFADLTISLGAQA